MQHLLLVNSQGVGAYVDRGHDPVLTIAHGDGKSAQARFELLIYEGESIFFDFHNDGA